MNKKLVLYYSLEGHTKKVAEIIASSINADIYEIKPKNEIKAKGFSKYLCGGSQVVMAKKPEIVNIEIDLEKYEEVYVGSPIWAWTFAPPIRTLLEDGYLKNKKISYFYTHGGGPKKAEERGIEEINKNNTFVSAIGIFDKDIRENYEAIKYKVEEWAKN